MEKWLPARHNSEIADLTYAEAVRYKLTYDSDVVDLAFKLETGAIMSQGWATISGHETLGVELLDFSAYGRSEYKKYDFTRTQDRPAPEAIDHQIDVAILSELKINEQLLVNKLKKMMFPKKASTSKPWYELFLTFYKLLSNLEFVHASGVSYMKSKMHTSLEEGVSHVAKQHIEHWENTAGNVLMHFRAILRGFLPFELVRNGKLDEFKQREELDVHAVENLQNIVQVIGKQKSQPVDEVDMMPYIDTKPGRWTLKLFQEIV